MQDVGDGVSGTWNSIRNGFENVIGVIPGLVIPGLAG
jgi:hypothetical protein